MTADDILRQLLDHLWKQQSWCPYCGKEVMHEERCILGGLFFPYELRHNFKAVHGDKDE